MRSVLPRAAIALVAVVLVAWSVVLWRDERIGSQAVDTILRNADLSDAAWAREVEDLRRAQLLHPGSDWEVARASALHQRGSSEEARRAIEDVIEREPDNFQAWRILAMIAAGRDPGRAARARAEIRRLNPRQAG